MKKTTFHIPKMDCPSEEQMIKLALNEMQSIKQLNFNLKQRSLDVFYSHHSDKEILEKLSPLNLGACIFQTNEVDAIQQNAKKVNERTILWIVLGINFLFFALEMIFGLISSSMGLVADSLDMLADSFVYALALMAVGASIIAKKRVARLSGYFQILLALIGFAEVIRRFMGDEIMPDFRLMIIISSLALIANIICLLLLQKAKSNEAHMQASLIFTSNDIAINIGVIVAGAMVWWLSSPIPDLVVGSIVFLIVMRGASRILSLAKR